MASRGTNIRLLSRDCDEAGNARARAELPGEERIVTGSCRNNRDADSASMRSHLHPSSVFFFAHMIRAAKTALSLP